MAWGLPACSDDDDGGGSSGSSGSGGSGASGGSAGSTGGSAGSSGSSGSGGSAGAAPVVCGGNTCQAWKLGGLIDLPACCAGAAQDECGAESTATTQQIAGVPAGCYELEQAGNVECDCPASPSFTNPITNEEVAFPGCCRASGACGYMVDLTSAEGPNMGCIEPWDNTSPAACTAGTPNPCPEPDGGADSGAGDASTD